MTSCRWGGDGPAAGAGGGIGPADGGGGIGPTDGGGSGGPTGGDGGLAGGGGASAFADDGELDGEPRFSKAWSFIKIFCCESESGSCCLTSCRWGGDGPAAGAGGSSVLFARVMEISFKRCASYMKLDCLGYTVVLSINTFAYVTICIVNRFRPATTSDTCIPSPTTSLVKSTPSGNKIGNTALCC